MGLSRLQNFIKNIKGNILYVDPNNLDATDSAENTGNSPVRPFVTLQRALIEAARFSYQKGLDNDRFERTTIMLSSGFHTIDNRPGLIPNWTVGNDPSYIRRDGTLTDNFPPFDLLTNFNLNSDNNILHKFNSISGGVIVPRGVSIVGVDLRKTKIRPLYVPDPTNDNIERAAVFKVTGGSHFWGFTILDADPNGYCYKNYSDNRYLPNFSHHKLTCFEYADGVNPVTIDDAFQEYSTTRTDLELFYEKVGLAYGTASGRTIEPDYPETTIDIQPKIDEFRIVGSTGKEVGITSIRAGDGVTSTNVITVDVDEQVEGIEVDTPIRIEGVVASGYDGQFVVSEVVTSTQFKYRVEFNPATPLPSSSDITSASLSIVSDTVTSASPYIFNVSLRSVFGMCGMHADGKKATGFKSMVVAQFTGISLQKDEDAFVVYDSDTGTYSDSTSVSNLSSNSRARYKPAYENFHIKASNNSIIQIVSVFAIGYSQHFLAESGGDLSITNSNSNFGAKSLVSRGFREEAFKKDDVGYISHIVSPQEIDTEDLNIEFDSIDVTKTTSVGISSHLYLFGQTNEDQAPEYKLEGYRIGAKRGDSLTLFYNSTSYNSDIVMEGSSESSAEKIYNVQKASDGISNEIDNTTDVITLTQSHDFANGEKIRVVSEDGDLPAGLLNNAVYYAITNDIDPSLAADEIKVAKSLNNALSGNVAGNQISLASNENSNLKVVSRVSDKIPGDSGHPIQWDSSNEQWYINTKTSNEIYTLVSGLSVSATSRTFITRNPDNRSAVDKIYKVRYVIPKNSSIQARPPLDGFILQEGSTNEIVQSEIDKYFSLTPVTLSSSVELRNSFFIANASWSANIATIETELPHNLIPGSQVQISNIISSANLTAKDNEGFNGTFIVTSVEDRKSFKVALSEDPGDFDLSQTIVRDTTLPKFKKLKFNGTYSVYRIQEYQEYIQNEQDGIYHLILVNSKNTPSIQPFTSSNFSQPIQNLYPRLDRDNPTSDPDSSTSFALPEPIGQVVLNDNEKSLTKESIIDATSDFSIGIGITNIVSNAVGTSHTIYTKLDHGLNRATGISIVSTGQGYGTGSPGTLYNAKLIPSGGTTGEGATAVIDVDASGALTDVKLIDGGSAFTVGDQLSVTGVSTITGFIAGIVSVTSVYNSTDEVLQLLKVSDLNNEYNNLYRITQVESGKTKEIIVSSASTITSPSTSGIGITASSQASLIPTGRVSVVSSIVYTPSSGIATVTTTGSHGLLSGHNLTISDSSNDFYNKSFTASKINNVTSFEINCGVTTDAQGFSGSAYVFKKYLGSNSGSIININENISGRLSPNYAGISTTLLGAVTSSSIDNLTINNAATLGLEVGDFLSINNEILRIKTTVTTNTVTVYRGLMGTRASSHAVGSVVRKIRVLPGEFRRNSIIRASGHTFEYVGYGPGNYSTSLPDKQDRKLSAQEELLAQSTKTDGGLTVFTGMNDTGNFYIGNKKVSSATGKEEVFDTPIISVTGEEIGGGVNIGFDVITPLEVSISRSLKVDGGGDNTIVSEFNGPVVFNNKVTTTSLKGLEAKTLYLQGETDVSRKYSVSEDQPTTSGGSGDIVFNSTPTPGGSVGWVYTDANTWEKFGKISTSGIIDNTIDIYNTASFIGPSASIDFRGTGGINILTQFNNATGFTTVTVQAAITDPATLNVVGVSTFGGTANFNGPAVFNNTVTINGGAEISADVGTYKTITYTNLTGDSTLGFVTFKANDVKFEGNSADFGTITKSSDTTVSVLSGDNNIAGFEAHGSTQGTGYVYVGQSNVTGGGMFYDGNGTPGFGAVGQSNDEVSFYRNDNGSKEVVFSYPFNSNNVTFRGDVNSTSDERLKSDIRTLDNSLNILEEIRGVEFNWSTTNKPSVGVIAQEVEKVLPQLVSEGDSKSVNYNGLIGVLIEAVKDQQKQINKLEEKIKSLEDR